LRDNTFNSKLKESEQTFTYLDIKQLKEAICEEVRILCQDPGFAYPQDNIIADYIFICFMLGNDFLDHLPSLLIKENGINALLKFYIKVLVENGYSPLVQLNTMVPLNQRINQSMLREILKGLAGSEEYFFKSVYSVYKNGNTNVYRDIPLPTENNNFLESSLYFFREDQIHFNQPGYKQRYYQYYGIDEQQIFQVCHDYLEGMLWVWGYYNTHEHGNWTWYYPHHATPFVSDLYQYLCHKSSGSGVNTSLLPSRANTPLEQLYMVLPRESLLGILAEIDEDKFRKTKRIFQTESSDLERYYPKKLSVDLLHREYLWQSKIFFEPFSKEFLRFLIN
jgi:5'-3' exonuclease